MPRIKQAIVMVGGKGTRLLPLTETRPKPVLPVNDRPCLWYLLRSMKQAGIEEVILACGYRSEKMIEDMGDGSDLGIKITYSFEDEPLGTAGAMKNIEEKLDDYFVAANGDVFADVDISEQIEEHFKSGAAITISLIKVPNPCEFGTALVEKDGRISKFIDKPKPEEVLSDLINAGIYVVDKRVLDFVPKNSFYDFSMHVFPKVLESGLRIQGYPLKGVWMDVGRPHDLLKANLTIAERYGTGGGTITNSTIAGHCYAGKNALILNSTLNNTVISRMSQITDANLDNVLVMMSCIVEGAQIINSILGEGCRIGKNAVIQNAVLRDGTVVEPGTVLNEGKAV